MKHLVLQTKASAGYELLDSGGGEKLERFGSFVLRRPDPEALYEKKLPLSKWDEANGAFFREGKNGKWKMDKDVPKKWEIEFEGLKLWIQPTSFKHTGLFPEQSENWKWMEKIIKARISKGKKIEVLNLFGYTGGATLAGVRSGAEVCHVDASKTVVAWGRENAELSGLSEKPIRWILDDAMKFLTREIKRGKKYDGILIDPPAFGHGPTGELWKIEEHFRELFKKCTELLSDDPAFFLINGYASGYSPLAYENNLLQLVEKYGGEIESGELAIEETSSKRLLPCGIFARWEK